MILFVYFTVPNEPYWIKLLKESYEFKEFSKALYFMAEESQEENEQFSYLQNFRVLYF